VNPNSIDLLRAILVLCNRTGPVTPLVYRGGEVGMRRGSQYKIARGATRYESLLALANNIGGVVRQWGEAVQIPTNAVTVSNVNQTAFRTFEARPE
jgi:hypothetical protein